MHTSWLPLAFSPPFSSSLPFFRPFSSLKTPFYHLKDLRMQAGKPLFGAIKNFTEAEILREEKLSQNLKEFLKKGRTGRGKQRAFQGFSCSSFCLTEVRPPSLWSK
jgi:hypothetical protein